MKRLLLIAVCVLSNWGLYAQLDNQVRFNSDHRDFFVWSEAQGQYLLKESEFEHAVIDIREMGSKTNGYIAISLVDNGVARLYHGTITEYKLDGDEKEKGCWSMRNKILRSRLVYDAKLNTITYSYEADEVRYKKMYIFYLSHINNFQKDPTPPKE